MNLLSIPFLRRLAPLGPLFLRLCVGFVMAAHGWSKYSGGVENVAGFFGTLGIPQAPIMAWVVTVVELVGGVCIMFGLLTRFWALLFAGVMVTVILVAKGIAVPSEYEFELALLGGALALAFGGPGGAALDRMLGIERS